MIVKTDCRYFKGDIPCYPHKKSGVHCANCSEYNKIDKNILIIKLGAIGDVIRTTPIIRRLRAEFPNALINWLTYSPEVLSKEWIDRILVVNPENIELIKQIEFDWLIVLDKDPIAISLSKQIQAKRKSGFTIDEFGRAKPISTPAEIHKWSTGLFNDLSKINTKHYVEEMFDIIGYEFNDEEYILDVDENFTWDFDKNKKIVGLNTGCGGRWSSRLWPEEYWIELSKMLLARNYEVILLGGEQENDKNIKIANSSGAKYLGHFNLAKFISLVNECNIVVSAVTMAMHIAMGLKKQVIIFNSIFNKKEFYLYGRGEIVEPNPKCECYYSSICPHESMKKIKPSEIFYIINKGTDG